MKLEKYYEWLKLNCSANNTINGYYQKINHFGKYCDYNFNQDNLNKYIIKIKEEGAQGSTINAFIYSFKNYLEYSKLDIKLPKPARVKKGTPKHSLTEKDLNEILRSHYDEEDLILRFMFYTGARPSEVVKIEKNHINFKNKDIIFYNTKGNKDRVIPVLNNDMFNKLKSHCDNLNEGYHKVFKITPTQLRRICRNIKKILDLDENIKITPKTLRVSFIKYCVTHKVDIFTLKAWCGHTDIKVTEFYYQPNEQERKIVAEEIRKEK